MKEASWIVQAGVNLAVILVLMGVPVVLAAEEPSAEPGKPQGEIQERSIVRPPMSMPGGQTPPMINPINPGEAGFECSAVTRTCTCRGRVNSVDCQGMITRACLPGGGPVDCTESGCVCPAKF